MPDEVINILIQEQDAPKEKMTREEMLDACKEVITKHRQNQYGTPEDNFGRIAKYWSVYLGINLQLPDVAMLMILLKVARGQHKNDNVDTWLDIAGYAACGCEVGTR